MAPAKRVSLRELHEQTETLVREAAAGGYAVVVTDRGRPLATITPYETAHERRAFRDRVLSEAFVALNARDIPGDVARSIEEDRDRF